MKKLFLLFLFFATPVLAQAPHGVSLTWQVGGGSDPAVGFNVYRSTSATGPFVKITAGMVIYPSYLDGAAGLSLNTSYFYYVTALDVNRNESVPSVQVSVSIPAAWPQPQIPNTPVNPAAVVQ